MTLSIMRDMIIETTAEYSAFSIPKIKIDDNITVPSTNKRAFPMPRGVYLARIWAIISVPPVLLPVLITSPMPMPFVRPVKSVQSHREDSLE